MLSSPALTLRCRVSVTIPPQQASGNGLPGTPEATVDNVAWTRFASMGVTSVSFTDESGIPSPLVSQLRLIVVGRNPQPTKFNRTLHKALIIPAVGVAVLTPDESGVAAAVVPTAG